MKILHFHSLRALSSTPSRLHHRIPKSFNALIIKSFNDCHNINSGRLSSNGALVEEHVLPRNSTLCATKLPFALTKHHRNINNTEPLNETDKKNSTVTSNESELTEQKKVNNLSNDQDHMLARWETLYANKHINGTDNTKQDRQQTSHLRITKTCPFNIQIFFHM